MESASNRSALLCQVSLPDFFNNLLGAPRQVAEPRYKSQPGIIFRGSGSWLEKQSEELKIGLDYYFPMS